MGFTLDPSDGALCLINRRGTVRFTIDGGVYHTRLAIMAIVVRLVHGAPTPPTAG